METGFKLIETEIGSLDFLLQLAKMDPREVKDRLLQNNSYQFIQRHEMGDMYTKQLEHDMLLFFKPTEETGTLLLAVDSRDVPDFIDVVVNNYTEKESDFLTRTGELCKPFMIGGDRISLKYSTQNESMGVEIETASYLAIQSLGFLSGRR